MSVVCDWNPEEVLALEPKLIPVYHPLLPNPTREEILELISTEQRLHKYVEWLNLRENRRRQSLEDVGDPFRYGFELDHWADADKIKDEKDLIWLIMLGGNRCLGGETEIYDPEAEIFRKVSEIKGAFHVRAWDGEKFVTSVAHEPFTKPEQDLFKVTLTNGKWFVASASHMVRSWGNWVLIGSIDVGDVLDGEYMGEGPTKVTSIKCDRRDVVWDFEVPVHHNYECAGVIHHNSGKSEYCAKRVVQDLCKYPRSFILCMAETEKSSIETQQGTIWKYLPREMKALNGKKDQRRTHYINYSVAHGFSEQQIVLPNASKIIFATYNGISSNFEGLEFGNRDFRSVGAWADESLTIPWFNMFDRRLRFRNAVGLWSFTPVRGMTPTIKEAVGNGKILETRAAELMDGKSTLPGIPPGEMPYIQEAAIPRAKVIYFFSKLNPFGNSAGTYYDQIKELCANKPNKYVMRVAYGYTTDATGKAFPMFSSVNIIKPEMLPQEGTNYHFCDPAGARNFANIWVRVSGQCLYIYRDWPDIATYGEWAVPTERELSSESRKGWDGDPGPAQSTLNFGVIQYKQLFRDLERVKHVDLETDPHRKERSKNGHKFEDIAMRFIDSRAGRDAKVAEEGGTCLVDMFAESHTLTANQTLDPVHFNLASGVDQVRGLHAIESLLYWDTSKPLEKVTNAPKLYVSSDCAQVIWALSNFTGRGGETGACKDFVDLTRYAALAELVEFDTSQPKSVTIGGY